MQRQSIASLDKESELLRTHLANARASAGSEASSPPAKAADGKSTKDKEPIDWKEAAEMQRNDGMGDMRAMIHLQQRVQSMTKEELVAAFDEIAKLDLPAEWRESLEQMLIGPLVEKDPLLALNRFADRLPHDRRNRMSMQLSSALGKWAEQDPGKATAWFDEQVAAGKFDSKSLDGRSQSLILFQGTLINTLLGSDPAAASRRLGAIPEDQRGEVLGHFRFQQLKDENQLAFAKLVRDQLPEKEQAYTLAQQGIRLVRTGGYEKVTDYIDRIGATPAERTACVADAAGARIVALAKGKKITTEALDAMRGWANSQDPGSADRLTGSALASVLENRDTMNFAEAAELAVKYHEASGNDDVLVNFLGDSEGKNKKAAIKLAEKISDPARREEVLKKFK